MVGYGGATLIGAVRVLLVGGVALLATAGVAQDRGGSVAVDLELVLAVDVSNSVDAGENAIQRAGYVDALGHPDFWAAIEAGPLRRIAVTYVEWAGPEKQRVALPWRLIDSAAAARQAAADLAGTAIMFTRGTGTSISGALLHSAAFFPGNGFDGTRLVIDVSGDGPNNRGGPVDAARDAVVAQGITINGLPLMLRPSRTFVQLDAYYQDCVIGGPGAFLLPVLAADQLAQAIRHKLVREIAGHPGPTGDAPTLTQAGDRTDCRLGDWPPYRPSPT